MTTTKKKSSRARFKMKREYYMDSIQRTAKLPPFKSKYHLAFTRKQLMDLASYITELQNTIRALKK